MRYHGIFGAAVTSAVLASTSTGCSSFEVKGSLPRRKKVVWCGLENEVPGNAMNDSFMPGAFCIAPSIERCSEPRSATGTTGSFL
ncbi:hypothetical protein D3C72_1905710 [compost metagenome]